MILSPPILGKRYQYISSSINFLGTILEMFSQLLVDLNSYLVKMSLFQKWHSVTLGRVTSHLPGKKGV